MAVRLFREHHAVEAAHHRINLGLVVSQRVDDGWHNRGVLPLPNLETRFVTANTLLPLQNHTKAAGGQLLIRTQAIEEKEQELAEVRRHHFEVHSREAKLKCQEKDRALRQELAQLLREQDFQPVASERLAAWDPYDPTTAADFFDTEWMFGLPDGFDITIGNPPYVRADSGAEHLAMRQRIAASGLYETLYEKWDLFIPFIERSIKLLRPGGFSSLIVSDAFCHAKYARKCQELLLRRYSVKRLDFYSKIQIFEAGVHNVSYLVQRVNSLANIPERRSHFPEFGVVTYLHSQPQVELDHRAFFPEEASPAAVGNATAPLAQICYVSYGLRPSSDENEAKGEFVTSDVVSQVRDTVHPIPYVEGKHLACWWPRTHLWIEWGTERAPARFCRPTFSELHFQPEKIVAQRSPGPDPLAAYDDRSIVFTASSVGFVPWHRLAGVRNRSIEKTARYSDEGATPGGWRREGLEAFSRRFAVKYLLAVMNSTFARQFLRANRRSNIHLYPDDWKSLPIPVATAEEQALIVTVVDQILGRLRADSGADVSDLEAKVDAMVSRLYGMVLSEETDSQVKR